MGNHRYPFYFAVCFASNDQVLIETLSEGEAKEEAQRLADKYQVGTYYTKIWRD